MSNDDTHAQHNICNSKRVVLFRVALFLLNACLSQNVYISSVFFPGAIIPVHLFLNVI